MQGSNARKKIVLGLSLGLAVLTGCQNMRGKLPAPKLSMPSVKMPNLLAWRDKDESAVLSSTESEAEPPTPSTNATPYAAYGATGNRGTATPPGVSPVSYPATPYPTTRNPMDPAGSGSRNPSTPQSQTPNYQIGPYGVTAPPRTNPAATMGSPQNTTARSSGTPDGTNAYSPPPGRNTALSDRNPAPGGGTPSATDANSSGPQGNLASQWDSVSTRPQGPPATTERQPLDSASVSQWDHLDPAPSPPAVEVPDPPSAVSTPVISGQVEPADGAAVSSDPASNPPVSSPPASVVPVSNNPMPEGSGAHNPVADSQGSNAQSIATSTWEQPSAPALATHATDSATAAPAPIAQISHTDPASDPTPRPEMNSYSDHVAAQGAMPWRPGSTESYEQATATSIADAIRSAGAQAAESPSSQTNSPQTQGGPWPSTAAPHAIPPLPGGPN